MGALVVGAAATLVGANLIVDTTSDSMEIIERSVDLSLKEVELNYKKYMLSNAMTRNYLGTTALVGLNKNARLNKPMSNGNWLERLYWTFINAKQVK